MWNRKHCAICRLSFAVHPNAKTVHTRTLCVACRKAMELAKRRRKALEIDYTGRRGRGWEGLQPIDISNC